MVFAGTQWVNAKPGGKFKLDMVVTDNADDPNVPSGRSSCPTIADGDRASVNEVADTLLAGAALSKRFGALIVLDQADFAVAPRQE